MPLYTRSDLFFDADNVHGYNVGKIVVFLLIKTLIYSQFGDRHIGLIITGYIDWHRWLLKIFRPILMPYVLCYKTFQYEC